MSEEKDTVAPVEEKMYGMEPTANSYVRHEKHRYPHCIVWTPLPVITWIFPFIGHMGICTSQGVIRDFAGPYTVTEDDMAFGWPTRYWQLDMDKVGKDVWDRGVSVACEEYGKRMHNLFCDNCHSHVAYALNHMNYNGSQNWNMVKLCFLMLFRGRFTGFGGFLKTWLPFTILVTIIVLVACLA